VEKKKDEIKENEEEKNEEMKEIKEDSLHECVGIELG
jgi:hypothetical protein